MLGLRGPASVTTRSHRGGLRSRGWSWTPPQLRCGVGRIIHCVDEVFEPGIYNASAQKALTCLQTRLECFSRMAHVAAMGAKQPRTNNELHCGAGRTRKRLHACVAISCIASTADQPHALAAGETHRRWRGGALHAASRKWHTATSAAPFLRAAGGAPCAGAGARGRAAVAADAALRGPAACAPVPGCQQSRRARKLGPTAGGAPTYGCQTMVVVRVTATGQGLGRIRGQI